MSQSVITTAFEQLKAEQAANGGVLTLDEFVFANVPDLNITDPIDRGESWPAPEQIVHRQDVSKTGTVNGNAVVYSVVLGAETGDFDFNWIGLINKASNTVAMIVHAPVQKKMKTASGQQGNVLTRSFMMEYNGASQITQITTPADTWQIDFTARLAGMDERIRKENIDTYGAASFYHDGFLVSREDGGYSVKKGVGYVGGLRAELLLDKEIAAAELPVKVWVDVCWKGLLTSVWDVETKIAVAETLNDYSDNGQQHYVFAIAEIQADGTINDLRDVPVIQNKDVISVLNKKQPLHEALTEFSDLQIEGNALLHFDNEKKMQLISVTKLAMKLLANENVEDILSDLGLGDLGEAARKNVGEQPGEVAAGDDLRIVNAVQPSNPALCTAWVNFNGSNPATIRSSYNVSSVTRLSTGKYQIVFEKPMLDSDYAVSLTIGDGAINGTAAPIVAINTSSTIGEPVKKDVNGINIITRGSGGLYECSEVNAFFFGGR